MDICERAARGDLEAVQLLLLRTGCSVDQTRPRERSYLSPTLRRSFGNLDPYRTTPLQYAVEYGHERMTRFLVAQGADLGLRNSMREGLLYMAARRNHVQLMEILLREFDIYPSGYALHGAAEGNSLEAIAYLIDHCSITVDIRNMTATPAHVAVGRNHLAALELLIKKGANISSLATSLMHVLPFRTNCRELINILVAAGANVNDCPSYLWKQLFIVPDNLLTFLEHGLDPSVAICNPLLCVIETDNVECAKTLLEFGADPSLRVHGKSETIFDFAQRCASQKMVSLLDKYC